MQRIMSVQIKLSSANQNIPINGQQVAAIAYLGQLALSKPGAADLFAEAATLIAQSLPADLVMLWELEADRKHISLRTVSGWREETVSLTQVALDPTSLEGFALESSLPVLLQDLRTETRVKPLRLLLENGFVSGLCIRVGTIEGPVGFLEAFSKQSQTFSQSDIQFLQSTGSILALFLNAQRAEQECKKLAEPAQPAELSGDLGWERHEINNRLVESRERERLRLAQELHDRPIQDLYGLMYQLDDMKDLVRGTEGMSLVDDFNQTLQKVVSDLRAICGDLRPPSLSPFGLEVAIRDHVERLQKQMPQVQFHLELMQDQQEIPDSLRLCLFRIYQQAINNVLRHAEASDVYVRFRLDSQVIQLEVEDNGIGFEVPQHWIELVRQEHFGLVGLAERVKSVHGQLEIVSAPADGTLVRILVPRR